MSATRFASVLGLGFGDCGKGHFIDAMTRRWSAHTVVRFSGGAQAGHNVHTPADAGSSSRHHTFSQFGAGTLVPGTRTVLLDPMVVHPTALLVETEALGRIGVHALHQLTIDARCRVTTPFHQAAGRLRELLRGAGAHGTCGVGVGETVRHALEHPDQVLRYADLSTRFGTQPLDKLQVIRETLLHELQPLCQESDARLSAELKALRDDDLARRWLRVAQVVARECRPTTTEAIAAQLIQPGTVLFEGAQGILLDEWRGFHPHTTWSSITTTAVEDALASLGLAVPVEHYGVLRPYLTRHGAGPLPTHDPALDAPLPEPHNQSAGWQGSFRRGHPDAVLLRYALEAIGSLSGLLVSHLDLFERGVSLQWCERYRTSSEPGRIVESLPLGDIGDLDHQSQLTALLANVQPQYASERLSSAQDYLDRLAEISRLPVLLHSHGNTSSHVCTGANFGTA